MQIKTWLKSTLLKTDKKFRIPRYWSNRELKRFAPLFSGDIVNVSGWTDSDKEGKQYSEYFANAKSYSISNFEEEKKGIQGLQNEFFLDLEKNLPQELNEKFDVVFNHTTLEHIYDFKTAFSNLCSMSKDIVIIVVPFLQLQHGTGYGDYWRFSPLAVKQLFNENHLQLIYLSSNPHKKSSVYLFAIASREPDKWKKIGKPEDYNEKYDSSDWGKVGEKAL